MKGPLALMAAVAMFAVSWRFSNWTVRAGNHRNEWVIRMEAEGLKAEFLLKIILPANMVSDLANRTRAALASSSAVRRVA